MKIPHPIPPEGVYIVLNSAYTGIKGIPEPVHISNNNLWQKFQLFEDRIVTRVIFDSTHSISDIEKIHYETTAFGNPKLIFSFFSDSFTFVAVPEDEYDVFDSLRFFNRKGVRLSPEAQTYLIDYAAAESAELETLANHDRDLD